MPSGRRSNLVMRETRDFESMRELALRSGLEDGKYENFAKAFGFYDGETLVACAALKVASDTFSLECVAVSADLRRSGLGRQLINALEVEARRRGASRLWALARAPAFFERLGFKRTTDREPGGPNLDGCLNCRQYGVDCHPSLVVKTL